MRRNKFKMRISVKRTPLQGLSNDLNREFKTKTHNIDLMKTEVDITTSKFFDTITSNLFVPHITYPTRITTTTSTLIDNIFSNTLNFMKGTSGNLTVERYKFT